MQLTTRVLLTPYAPILYTLLKENVHAMRLALRGKANGFYMLPSIESVLWSAVEVFLCVERENYEKG